MMQFPQVGGVPTGEVNSLELEFLFSINFSLHVTTEVYERYYSELANHMGVGVPVSWLWDRGSRFSSITLIKRMFFAGRLCRR